MGATFSVLFYPDNKTVEFAEPVALSDAAAYADVLIDHPCGSNATCGKCRVLYKTSAPLPTPAEQRLLAAEELLEGWRLSCQCVIAEAATIEVPALSRAASAKGFGDDGVFAAGIDPWVHLHEITLPEPDLDWQWALEDALVKQLGLPAAPRLSLEQLRNLPEEFLRKAGELSVLLHGDDVLCISAGSVRSPLGVAIDIGSTSLAAALVDLSTGQVLSTASALNPQVKYGGDVISRIDYAMQNHSGNEQLHKVLISELNALIARLRADAEVDLLQIWSVCVCGNPAMLHTFLGVDVRQLGVAPYVGAWTRGLTVSPTDIGMNVIRKEALVRVMPMIRSNVGADTVAAIIAAGIDQSDEMTVMIDLGTNCEVVIGNRERMLVTSTAAGPAFEGASMQHGMRAAPGAIDRVSLRSRGRIGIRVLGGVKARGICGSGLMDAAAALLRTGVIDATGRMRGRDALNESVFPELASRIVSGEHGHAAVILARPEESERGPVMLSALDIRQLQLIKGSIHAGISLLLKHWGLGYENIDRILIAGAFGSYLRKSSVMDIGLVPQIDPEKVHFIGNAAGVGARMALVDRNAWRRAEAIRENAEYLELGGHPEYQDVFGTSMGFFDSPALLEANR